MRSKKLGLIHTSATLVPVFAKLCAEKLPEVEVFNIADDSLIKEVIQHGKLTPSVVRRVVGHVAAAESAGANLILVTCSSIGSAVEAAAGMVDVPVFRVDQPMADEAVRTGRRIGVAATLATTLTPTAELIERRAQVAGKEVELTTQLCAGAFEILMSGDPGRHDAMVAETLHELSQSVDVIVLAQASMARVADALPQTERHVPILASPSLAIEHLARLI